MSGRMDALRRSRAWSCVLVVVLLVAACVGIIFAYAWVFSQLFDATGKAVTESGIEFHLPDCKNDGSFEICRDAESD